MEFAAKKQNIAEVTKNLADIVVRHRERSAISPGTPVDFSRFDLGGADLKGLDLSAGQFVGMNMSGTLLAGANLTNANMFGANLSGADLRKANLTRANLRGACLEGARLNKAILTEADLRSGTVLRAQGESDTTQTRLTNCALDYACLQRTHMAGANLRGSSFVGADLRGAKLNGADLTSCILTNANLHEADLSGAQLVDSNFEGASLHGASLENAQARGVNFRKAIFTNAIVSGLDFTQCQVEEAVLTVPVASLPVHVRNAFEEHENWLQSNGTDGRRGTLVEEDLRAVDLSGRNLSGFVLHRSCLAGANLRECLFILADLTDCDLSGTDIAGAQFMGAVLTGVNFSGASVDNAKFGSVPIVGADGRLTGVSRESVPVASSQNPPVSDRLGRTGPAPSVVRH